MWGYSVFGLGIVFQESVDGRAAFVGARPPCRRLETYLLVHVMLISELCTGWNADPWGAAAGFPRLDAYPMGMNLVQHPPNALLHLAASKAQLQSLAWKPKQRSIAAVSAH